MQRDGDTRRFELLGLGGEGVLHDVPDVDLNHFQMDDVLVALGDEEETVSEVDDTVDFAGCSPDRLREVFGRTPGSGRELELRAQDGEGASQFVAGCGREASLAFDGGVEAAEQVVEGDCESCKLVVGRGHTQGCVAVACGDV